jgi:hypothetical protein
MKIEVLLLILLSIFVTACGQGNQTHTSFVVSQGAVVTSGTMDGGLSIQTVGTGGTRNYDVQAPHSVSIPYGSYDMYFVGYVGPTAWAGTPKCAKVVGAVLSQPNQSLSITIDSSTCATDPIFTNMINAKLAKWGTAIWNQSQWAP